MMNLGLAILCSIGWMSKRLDGTGGVARWMVVDTWCLELVCIFPSITLYIVVVRREARNLSHISRTSFRPELAGATL